MSRKVESETVRPSPIELRFPHLGDAVQRAVDKGIGFCMASNARIHSRLNMNPYGQVLSWLDFTVVSSQQWSTHEFLNIFNAMNGIAFNVRGLPMPHWVMIDLALMPSAALIATVPQGVFLSMIESSALGEAQDHMLAVLEGARGSNYNGPIPIGGYCAAPSAVTGRWVGWSLWSVIPSLGLGLAVKSLALAAYRSEQLDGVTQYNNAALRIHTQFGPLRITAATVPLHSSSGSFVYENDFTLPAGDELQPTFFLDPSDTARQQAMQAAIEAGESDFFVIPPGRVRTAGNVFVPILEVPRRGRDDIASNVNCATNVRAALPPAGPTTRNRNIEVHSTWHSQKWY